MLQVLLQVLVRLYLLKMVYTISRNIWLLLKLRPLYYLSIHQVYHLILVYLLLNPLTVQVPIHHLNDNATGTPNASAPGAHRYSITAVLSTQAVNANSGNFVLIARLEAGVVTKNARTADYNILER